MYKLVLVTLAALGFAAAKPQWPIAYSSAYSAPVGYSTYTANAYSPLAPVAQYEVAPFARFTAPAVAPAVAPAPVAPVAPVAPGAPVAPVGPAYPAYPAYSTYPAYSAYTAAAAPVAYSYGSYGYDYGLWKRK